MKLDINQTIKAMKSKRMYNEFVNATDYLSYTRSGRFYSLTVIYDMKDNSRKKIDSLDTSSWSDVERWLRGRFDLNWKRKREPGEVKFL